jgi:hypothetical protein
MNDLTYWTAKLKEAERELEAAARRSEVNAAAKKLQLAKAELKRLEQKALARETAGEGPEAALGRGRIAATVALGGCPKQ